MGVKSLCTVQFHAKSILKIGYDEMFAKCSCAVRVIKIQVKQIIHLVMLKAQLMGKLASDILCKLNDQDKPSTCNVESYYAVGLVHF